MFCREGSTSYEPLHGSAPPGRRGGKFLDLSILLYQFEKSFIACCLFSMQLSYYLFTYFYLLIKLLFIMTKAETIKEAVELIKANIKLAEANPNVITGIPVIPAGSYVATFALKEGIPSFEVTKLVGTTFSKSSVPMNLVHSESGKKLNEQDVSYNNSLEPILTNSTVWENQYIVHTENRISSKNNPYQVIIFDGILELVTTE